MNAKSVFYLIPMQVLEFQKEYILENDRVKLQPLQVSDFKQLRYFALHEPEIWKYSQQPADSVENLEKYISMALQGRKEKEIYPFIIYDKLYKEYAGSTRFYDYHENHRTVQLGYTWYGKKFQGTGLNKECKLLLLAFAFEQLGLERVEFRADTNNARSIAAMKSLGCTVEGVLRNNCSAPKGRRDSIVLSILKEEWFGKVKEQLEVKIEMNRKQNK